MAISSLALGALPTLATAVLPAGEQLKSGQAIVIRPDRSTVVVEQSSRRAIPNWSSFSIGQKERVSVLQPDRSSVLLNRVTGPERSDIRGALTASGQVFLVNPNGILFGPNASVDVGGFVASTLDIADSDFMAGRYRFAGAGSPMEVINQGTLRAADGGTIALLGGQVRNDGTIVARLGTAGLAASNKITLDFAGDGLTRITVDESALRAQIDQGGVVVADGGQVVVTARAADALTETVVNQSGVVRARALVERAGRIVLDSGATGVTLVSGTLDASGASLSILRERGRVRRRAAPVWIRRARDELVGRCNSPRKRPTFAPGR